MSEEQTEQVVQTEEQPIQEQAVEDTFEDAWNAIDQDEQETETTEQPIQEQSTETTEPPQEQEQEQEKQMKASEEFKRLSQLDRENRQSQNRLKELEYRNKQLTDYYQQNEAIVGKIKQDPIGFIKQLGVTDDHLISYLANGNGQPTQQEQPREDPRISQLQQQIQELTEYKQQQVRQTSEAGFIQALQAEVNNSPDDYELVVRYSHDPHSPLNSIQLAKSLASEYYRTYGESPTGKQILATVEDYLLKQVSRAKDAKKVSGLFTPAQQAAQPPQAPPPAVRRTPELQQGGGISSHAPKNMDEMNEDEAWAVAWNNVDKMKED